MESIRNVCILAHVDHGKTTLADNLLYSNGIISKNSAGDLRHLDSTQDEQERGITMKSSCISLRHLYSNKLNNDSENKPYIINLIDSPGHVDFCGEVSSAVKISDSAFVIVDVIEGVSSQTRTVIQQAWKERLQFILVLNKIDRMITELKLQPTDAYRKLELIIQDVHHIIGEMISLDVRAEEEATDSIFSAQSIAQKYDTNPFMPLKGRVVFCSAFHQWGFRISDFVSRYSLLLGIDMSDLFKKMWGDFYINSKKKICKGASANDRKNIFTSLILEPIFSVYNAIGSNEADKVIHMMSKLDISVEFRKSARESKSQIDNIRNVFGKWMPLPTVLLDALVEKCPNPRVAMVDKKLSFLVPNENFSQARNILKLASTDKEAPSVVFITKFMLKSHSNNDLIGLGRIYSGQVKPDLKMFVFTPRFNPFKVSEIFLSSTADDFEEGPINVYGSNEEKSTDVYVTKIQNVFQFMGDGQILLKDGAHAGHIVGFTGVNCQQAYKNVTLVGKCSLGDSFGMFSQGENWLTENCNIICVSIEPKKVTFLNELQEALLILERSDPIVNVSISSTGQMLLYAAGEIHLQKCINELTRRIAPHIELDVSSPIVPFRETVTHRALCDMGLSDSIRSLSEELKMVENNVIKSDMDPSLISHQQGFKDSIVVYIRLPQKSGIKLCCRISIHSLPSCLIEWIEKNSLALSLLSNANKLKRELSKSDSDCRNHLMASFKAALETANNEEQEICANTETCPLNYSLMFDKFWTIGNHQNTQCNVLFNYIGQAGLFSSNDDMENSGEFGQFFHSMIKGFQRALKEGPICQELMKNTAFIIHSIWEVGDETVVDQAKDKSDSSDMISNGDASHDIQLDKSDPFSSVICVPGQMSALVTKACQTALICHPGSRIMIAMYKVDLEVRINTYKHLSSIINQLHGQIVKQEVNFGNFIVEAKLPVIESFGFGDKLRKKTSGEVGLPQLKNIFWELLNCSPLLDMNLYKTIVDRAENCDIGISPELVSRTQKYINGIRLQKGIQVRKQLIECGDKQRTLNKKK